jgi:hypothetical protein
MAALLGVTSATVVLRSTSFLFSFVADANRLLIWEGAERSLARGVRQAPLSIGEDWDAGYAWWQERARVSRAPTVRRGALGMGFGGDGSCGGAYG